MTIILPIPTPVEIGYYDDADVRVAIEIIRTNILNKSFRFSPRDSWSFSTMAPKINAQIDQFGWKIEQQWIGQSGEASAIWIIKPI